jgi:hypothetical protein
VTPEELKDLRLNARFLAIEALLVGQISAHVQSEDGRQEQCRQLDLWLESLREMKFPEMPPEMADLYAGEVHEAASSLVEFAKRRLRKPRGS